MDVEYSFTVYRTPVTAPFPNTPTFTLGSFTYTEADIPSGTVTVSETNDTRIHESTNAGYYGDTTSRGRDPEGRNDQKVVEFELEPDVVGQNFYTTGHYLATGSDGSQFNVFRLRVSGPGVSSNGYYMTKQPFVEGVTYTIGNPIAGVDGSGGLAGRGVVDAEELYFAGAVDCFTRGTLITTDKGEVAIEDLRAGDMVLTMDAGYQAIQWIGSKKVSGYQMGANPKLRPIRISAGAMGLNLPQQDLVVSRQHRMLVKSRISERMFDTPEVLVSAIKLCAMPGIYVDEELTQVEYFHMLFDRHQVVYANGTPSESLFTGPEALKALTPAAREEIETLFPEICAPEFEPAAAREIPCGKRQKS